jgi:cysteine desulfurase / selenocysteine lyase
MLRVKEHFPLLVNKELEPLYYLDSAATSQQPSSVIASQNDYLLNSHANVHRGLHKLSQRASASYEGVRTKIGEFLNSKSEREIIFVKGATEGINLVAQTFGERFLNEGDEIVLTELEHHANIVPWQLLAAKKNIVIKVIPITEDGNLDLVAAERIITDKTKLLSLTHVSNVLGIINPVKEVAKIAKSKGAKVLVDGSQAAAHFKIDVQDLDIDFYVFTGHKTYGPTGIGVLYGSLSLLEALPPFLGGGDMIESVSFSGSSYAEPPYRFEAGTPPIASVIGLGAAIDYLHSIGWQEIREHDQHLVSFISARIKVLGEKITTYGQWGRDSFDPLKQLAIFPFNLKKIHPQDVAMILDNTGVAVRTGQHCAEPLVRKLGCETVIRASAAIYTEIADLEALFKGIDLAYTFF